MRADRPMVLIDRVIPFLAALIGLIALAGAVLVQLNVQQRDELVAQELAAIRTAIDDLSRQAEALGAAVDDGTADGLLALQDRMNTLEEAWENQPAAAAAVSGAALDAGADNPSRVIDPAWPTEDCIPTNTRFIAMAGESYPICQSPAVLRLSAITADSVVVEGGGVISTLGSGALPGTSCTAMVLSADAEGFAELRITCQ